MLQAHPAWVHSLMQQLQKVLGQKRIHLFQRLHSTWHFCLSHQQSGMLISRYSNQSCQSFWGLPEPQFWSVVPAFVLFVIIYQMLHGIVSKTDTLLEKKMTSWQRPVAASIYSKMPGFWSWHLSSFVFSQPPWPSSQLQLLNYTETVSLLLGLGCSLPPLAWCNVYFHNGQVVLLAQPKTVNEFFSILPFYWVYLC